MVHSSVFLPPRFSFSWVLVVSAVFHRRILSALVKSHGTVISSLAPHFNLPPHPVSPSSSVYSLLFFLLFLCVSNYSFPSLHSFHRPRYLFAASSVSVEYPLNFHYSTFQSISAAAFLLINSCFFSSWSFHLRPLSFHQSNASNSI